MAPLLPLLAWGPPSNLLCSSLPEKHPASMRKEAVEAAVKRASGCCCSTDSTLPTATPTPPAASGSATARAAHAPRGGRECTCENGWHSAVECVMCSSCAAVLSCASNMPQQVVLPAAATAAAAATSAGWATPQRLACYHQFCSDTSFPASHFSAARLAPEQRHGGLRIAASGAAGFNARKPLMYDSDNWGVLLASNQQPSRASAPRLDTRDRLSSYDHGLVRPSY